MKDSFIIKLDNRRDPEKLRYVSVDYYNLLTDRYNKKRKLLMESKEDLYNSVHAEKVVSQRDIAGGEK